MNETWRALAHEAGLAAEHLAIGATALGKANYAQPAYFSQAFFALSIGVERTCKLALVVDHHLAHGGFPTSAQLRGYGHNLESLMTAVATMSARRGFKGEAVSVPDDPIHQAIVAVLTRFANNVTRYYNLEVISGSQHPTAPGDVVSEWHQRVTLPVLERHYPPRTRQRDQQMAEVMDDLIGDFSLVRHHRADGQSINSVKQAALEGTAGERARPWERMYVLQLARFLAAIMRELTHEAYDQRAEDVPHLSEFYAIFGNDDAYFRSRKTWTIH